MFRKKRSSWRISSIQNLSEDTVECTTWLDRLRGRRRFKRRVLYRKQPIPIQVQRPPLIPEAPLPMAMKTDPLLRGLLLALLVLLIAAVSIFVIRQYLAMQGSLRGLQGMAEQYREFSGKGP